MKEMPRWCLKDKDALGKGREEKGKKDIQAKEELKQGFHPQGM